MKVKIDIISEEWLELDSITIRSHNETLANDIADMINKAISVGATIAELEDMED